MSTQTQPKTTLFSSNSSRKRFFANDRRGFGFHSGTNGIKAFNARIRRNFGQLTSAKVFSGFFRDEAAKKYRNARQGFGEKFMEARTTQTVNRQSGFDEFASYQRESEIVRQRLDYLLTLNAETERQKQMSESDKKALEVDTMTNPLNTEKTFSYFGLMLGAFPPAAFFIKFAVDTNLFVREEAWVLGIFFIVNLVSAIVGYFTGKFTGRSVREAESFSWLPMIFLLPFIGMFWGIMAGGAGGAVILIFGAFFGAILGAVVGGVALPIFTIFHRLLKKGEYIELKHFLPIAFGVTFAICSFILGL